MESEVSNNSSLTDYDLVFVLSRVFVLVITLISAILFFRLESEWSIVIFAVLGIFPSIKTKIQFTWL